jgi:hypothetical protein
MAFLCTIFSKIQYRYYAIPQYGQILDSGSQSVVHEPLEDGAIFFLNGLKRRNILLTVFNIIQTSLPGIALAHSLDSAQ